jgi:dTDP-4-dehydrorhamnose reductase
VITPLVVGHERRFAATLSTALTHAGFAGHSTSAAALDLSNPDDCRRVIVEARADTVIDCGGAPDLQPKEAGAVVRGLATRARSIACAAAHEGARCVFISSASVYAEGAAGPRLESDPAAPSTPLGESLLAAERAIAHASAQHTILRTSSLYGATWADCLEQLLAQANERDHLSIAPRRVTAPTYAPHLAQLVVEAIRRPCYGIVHRASDGECNLLELVRAVMSVTGTSCRIEPAPTNGPSPRHTQAGPVVLASRRDDLPTLPHWRIGLRAYALERSAAAQR